MNTKDLLLVENFDYFMTWFHRIAYIAPPAIRRMIWKAVFAEFGKGVLIGEKSHFHYPWKIKIGAGTAIGRGCNIFPSYQFKDVYVTFGKNVLVAPNLTIFGAGHPVAEPHSSHVAADVVIEDDVYVGGNVTIRYGVHVGRGAIIAAGSVVVKDVKAGDIVGGNPARVFGSVS
jgi:acetyltransferase-like isoleucine patch superfamily enzyme